MPQSENSNMELVFKECLNDFQIGMEFDCPYLIKYLYFYKKLDPKNLSPNQFSIITEFPEGMSLAQ